MYVFADFQLDLATVELRRAGERVHLQPKVFKLLMHLVENRHRSVTNEELLAVLWPNERVSPASITTAVRSARIALGDAGTSQAAIRTVRGHGYRFVLPVSECPSAVAAVVAAACSRGDDAPTSGSGRPTDPSDAPFVGRAGVLAAIDQAIANLDARRGGCLLLTGEPGIGKTRTLFELCAHAREADAHVWVARCLEGDGAPPFWPLMQLVREAADDLGAEALRTLMGGAAADVAQAIPDLKHWLPDLPEAPELTPSTARFRFFDGLCRFLKRVAAIRPLVLVIDDLQQADEPTARLLSFLVQQLGSDRVLIAAATRPVQPGRPAFDLARDLGKAAISVAIDLAGFSVGEVAHYLTQRTGAPPPESVVSALHDQTAGNPLYLQQLTHSICMHHHAGSAPPWEQLLVSAHGHSVSTAIERLLDGVSADCRLLLQTAAVLGRDFALGVLLDCTDAKRQPSSRERVLSLLAEARTAGLMSALDTPNQYRFRHALIREALYGQLTPQERASLHERAALALEALGAGSSSTQLAQLADHYCHAAPVLGTERALHYLMRAADDATQKLAYEEAAAHADRALSVLELDPPDRARRLALLLAKGEALSRATLRTPARTVLLEAASLARELGAHEILLTAVTLFARPAEFGAPDPTHVAWLREALSLLGADDPRRPELTALLAKSLSYTRGRQEYQTLALSALESARTKPHIAHRADTLYACHEALAGPEHLTVRMEISNELSRLGRQLGDPGVLMNASITQIWNAVERGDMTTVALGIDQLDSYARHVREPLFAWAVTMYRAMRATVAGDLAEASAQTDAAREFGPLIGEAFAEHTRTVQVSAINLMHGRFRENEELLRSYTARYPALAGWRATLATLHAYFGHRAHARHVLEDLVADDLRALEVEPYLLSALAPTAGLCGLVGDAALARPLYDAILPFESLCGTVAYGQATHGPMARHLGVLALCMGDARRAVAHLDGALAHAERMQSPPFVAVALATRASALIETDLAGARDEALANLAGAREIAEALDLEGVRKLCISVGAKLGVSP